MLQTGNFNKTIFSSLLIILLPITTEQCINILRRNLMLIAIIGGTMAS